MFTFPVIPERLIANDVAYFVLHRLQQLVRRNGEVVIEILGVGAVQPIRSLQILVRADSHVQLAARLARGLLRLVHFDLQRQRSVFFESLRVFI